MSSDFPFLGGCVECALQRHGLTAITGDRDNTTVWKTMSKKESNTMSTIGEARSRKLYSSYPKMSTMKINVVLLRLRKGLLYEYYI